MCAHPYLLVYPAMTAILLMFHAIVTSVHSPRTGAGRRRRLAPRLLSSARCVVLARFYLRIKVGFLLRIALGGARLDLRLGLPDRRQALFAPRQLGHTYDKPINVSFRSLRLFRSGKSDRLLGRFFLCSISISRIFFS